MKTNIKYLFIKIITILSTTLVQSQVGIGTTSPQAQLHIANGNVRVDNLVPTSSSGTNVSVDQNGTLVLSKINNKISILGKVESDGNTPAVGDFSVIRLNDGDYTITFGSPMIDENYVILLSVAESTRLISYRNQTVNGFDVKIQRVGFLGSIQDEDSEFMFKVEGI